MPFYRDIKYFSKPLADLKRTLNILCLIEKMNNKHVMYLKLCQMPVGTRKMYLAQIFSFPPELEPITAAAATRLTTLSS